MGGVVSLGESATSSKTISSTVPSTSTAIPCLGKRVDSDYFRAQSPDFFLEGPFLSVAHDSRAEQKASTQEGNRPGMNAAPRHSPISIWKMSKPHSQACFNHIGDVGLLEDFPRSYLLDLASLSLHLYFLSSEEDQAQHTCHPELRTALL